MPQVSILLLLLFAGVWSTSDGFLCRSRSAAHSIDSTSFRMKLRDGSEGIGSHIVDDGIPDAMIQKKAVKLHVAAAALGLFAALVPELQILNDGRSTVPYIAPRFANAGSLEDVNSKLADYGFPPMLYVPQGFSPLVSEYGRGNVREAMSNPILVQMVYPSLWVVQTTSVNNNGEAGTVSANDYIKGDSAFLYVINNANKGKLSVSSKDLVKDFLLKSLSQKGDPVDNLKVLKISEGPTGPDGQPYILVDFSYQLNTEAGFLISRQGVLSLTSVGTGNSEGSLQGLVAVTTDKRWRKSGLEEKIREIASSFRVYRLKSGLFSADT